MRKYGKDNFKMEMLCIGDEDYIIDLEIKAIEKFDAVDNGYNVLYGSQRKKLRLPESVKNSISKSLNKFYENNESRKKGVPTEKRSDDYFIFCSGFWFPNIRLTSKCIGISKKVIYRRIADGTVGDIIRSELVVKRSDDKPIFVEGFWFPAIRYAISVFNKSIRRNGEIGFIRNKLGSVEDSINKRKPRNVGDNNPMKGKTGDLHHNSKAIIIEGVRYGSISEAARESEYSKKQIYNRLKSNHEDFIYEQ
ncbi:hypothetical protein D3C86_1083010 [compost metagenome]